MKKNSSDKKYATTPSILERLFELVPEVPATERGFYDSTTQTWSHRDGHLMSPVKHNREH